jgi:hypothetical protein
MVDRHKINRPKTSLKAFSMVLKELDKKFTPVQLGLFINRILALDREALRALPKVLASE